MIEISTNNHVKVRFRPSWFNWHSEYLYFKQNGKEYYIGEKFTFGAIVYTNIDNLEYIQQLATRTGLTVNEISVYIDCSKALLEQQIHTDNLIHEIWEKDECNYLKEISDKTIKSDSPDELVDDFKNSRITSYVYLFHNYTNNLTKIGKSNNPNYRRRTLSSYEGSLEVLKLYKFQSSYQALDFEKQMHSLFKDDRKHGEWFDLPVGAIEKIDMSYSEYMESENARP